MIKPPEGAFVVCLAWSLPSTVSRAVIVPGGLSNLPEMTALRPAPVPRLYVEAPQPSREVLPLPPSVKTPSLVSVTL